MHKKYDGKIVTLPYPPHFVTIAICGYCMNSCQFCAAHCVDSGRNEKSSHQYNIPYFMSYEDFCRIVDICYEGRVPHIHIVAAGEPFLHKDIFKMIDYLISKYIDITFQTNFDRRLFESKPLVNEILKRKQFIHSITTDIFPPDCHHAIKKGSNYEFVLSVIDEISKNSEIIFDVHTILTKTSYKNLDQIVFDLYKRNVKFKYSVVNLHPHNFNDYTSPKNVFLSEDIEIQEELNKLKKISSKLGIQINIPRPWDKAWETNQGICLTYWSRFQVIPDKNVPKERWIGNTIPSQCNAVVIGNLCSLGNLFDYNNFMDFWNNTTLLEIRSKIINGSYPDLVCETCYVSDKSKFSNS